LGNGETLEQTTAKNTDGFKAGPEPICSLTYFSPFKKAIFSSSVMPD